jgi:hypothetical protein
MEIDFVVVSLIIANVIAFGALIWLIAKGAV